MAVPSVMIMPTRPIPPMSFAPRKIVKQPWKKWFAWLPVRVHKKRVWLKVVYRRKIVMSVDMDEVSYYEYGNIFDLITE